MEQMFLGLLFVNCRYYLGNETEPICSKFDYEKKTIEKMVRLEHAMELIIDWCIDLSEMAENTLSTQCMKQRVKERQNYYKH